jgi:hypothetical protein
MRAIGIDVHRDFCEVAVSEGGRLRSAGRVASRPEELELFAASLAGDDEVALEATGNALAIARILEPHVARVVVASARELHAISDAKAKTDRRDARTPASASSVRPPWSPWSTTCTASAAPASWSATWVSIPGCASPAARRRAWGTS